MHKLESTSANIADAAYYVGPENFFAAFGDMWDAAKGQVLKLETRQSYREPGNPSFEAFEAGDFDKALQLLPAARNEDVELYQSLATRSVDFVRCRPIAKPISPYLQWELECYRFNANHGERIYFLDRNSIFDDIALHDFIVFDRQTAVVHDYDEQGALRGGWVISEGPKIDSLIMLFAIIKADSTSWLNYSLK